MDSYRQITKEELGFSVLTDPLSFLISHYQDFVTYSVHKILEYGEQYKITRYNSAQPS